MKKEQIGGGSQEVRRHEKDRDADSGQETGWRTGCKTGKVRVGRMHLVNKHH